MKRYTVEMGEQLFTETLGSSALTQHSLNGWMDDVNVTSHYESWNGVDGFDFRKVAKANTYCGIHNSHAHMNHQHKHHRRVHIPLFVL